MDDTKKIVLPVKNVPGGKLLGKGGALDPYKPRKLFPEEINIILNSLHQIKGSDDVSTETAFISLKSKILIQLQRLTITPLGIPDLANEIKRQYERSIIEPGEMVGVLTAEALGGPITQMALNTFHTAGSSKNVTFGIDAIKNLIYASDEPKSPSCTIVFKDRYLTFGDVLEKKRGDIVGVVVSDVIYDYDIDSRSSFFQDGEPWWYDYFRTIVRNDIQLSNWILRLKINVNVLYDYKIQPQDICNTLEKNNNDKIFCVYSPILIEDEDQGVVLENGKIEMMKIKVPRIYIDIHPNDRKIGEITNVGAEIITDENRSLIFINIILLPNLDKMQIKGVPKIKALFPVESPVWQAISNEIPFTHPEFPRLWKLTYNLRRMKITGISRENVIRLCEIVGMTVFGPSQQDIIDGADKMYLLVQVPDKTNYADFDDIMKTNKNKIKNFITPGELVNYKISLDKKEEKIYEKLAKEERNILLKTDPLKAQRFVTQRPPSDISKVSQFVYADTNGSNLKVLLNRDDIDPNHTTSNNMHEILSILGIEATRNFLIKGIIDVISYDNQYINPRNAILLVDFMTHQGRILKIQYSGIKKQPIGALAQASFQ